MCSMCTRRLLQRPAVFNSKLPLICLHVDSASAHAQQNSPYQPLMLPSLATGIIESTSGHVKALHCNCYVVFCIFHILIIPAICRQVTRIYLREYRDIGRVGGVLRPHCYLRTRPQAGGHVIGIYSEAWIRWCPD